MAGIGLFYGSTTGNTKDAATRIKTAFGRDVVTVASIAGATADDLNQFDVLILGTSTWGFGDWQDDWAAFQRELAQVNWSGKRVALFGLGDQYSYPDTFVDAMGLLHDVVVSRGGRVVGGWTGPDYDFESSCAHRDGRFVGLALDADNQSDLTGPRIGEWVQGLKGELGL
jgi:flavodoxin I